jgi:hypothetical protein
VRLLREHKKAEPRQGVCDLGETHFFPRMLDRLHQGEILRPLAIVENVESRCGLNTKAGNSRTTKRYKSRSNFTGLKAFREGFIVPSVMKYQVREPLSAVFKEPGSSIAFLTIDSGAVITVKGDVQPYGFVEANYGGDDILVFMRDLELRADRVKGTAH